MDDQKSKSIKRLIIIKKYLERLENVHNKANTNSKKNLLKSAYYNKYIIKDELLKERVKSKKERNFIINNQKESLNNWIEYFEASDYPLLIKYWIFHGIIKMGNYDSILEKYNKRTKNTKNPFIEVNPLLVSECIKIIENIALKSDIDITKVLLSNSFKNIYTSIEKKYNNNNEFSSDGIWIKYEKGNKDDAINLCNTLKGKNTHWCIENEYKALNQICCGDIYIYYLKDQMGEYTIPKIGIGINNTNEISEIRGILEEQNVEEEMIPILEEKLKEIKLIDEFSILENLQIIEDLKRLTNIYKKTIFNEDLIMEDLIFLYTLYLSEDRIGFGYSQDPIVKKIIKKRNILDDYKIIEDDFIKSHILSKCTN